MFVLVAEKRWRSASYEKSYRFRQPILKQQQKLQYFLRYQLGFLNFIIYFIKRKS